LSSLKEREEKEEAQEPPQWIGLDLIDSKSERTASGRVTYSVKNGTSHATHNMAHSITDLRTLSKIF
jgi:hypothetical protein